MTKPIQHELLFKNGKTLINFNWCGGITEKTFLETDRVISRNVKYIGDDGKLYTTKYNFYICSSPAQYKELIENNPHSNLFEWIHTERRKIYLDFDIKSGNGLSRTQIEEKLSIIIEHFNNYFNKTISRTDFIVFTRDKEEIVSLHIIIPKYSTSRTNLCKYSIDLKTLIKEIDISVYADGKAFCLKYQSKNSTENPIDRCFDDYDDNTKQLSKDTSNYLIVETDKTEYVDILDSVYEKELENKKQVVCNDNIEDKDDPNLLPKLTDKEIIKTDKYTLVDKLLEHLPDEFFGKNKYATKWIYTTKLLYVFGCKNMDLWLNESAEKSNGEYTIIQNTDILSTPQLERFKWNEFKPYISVVNKHLIDLNKEFSKKFRFINVNLYDTKELRNWLSKKTEISINKINDIYNTQTPETNTKSILLNEFYIFYQKSLSLENLQTKTQLNYWIDEYYKQTDNIGLPNFTEITQEELKKQFKEDIKNTDIKHIGINAKWGMGKTSNFIMEAIDWYLEHNKKVLVITESNSLNSEFYNNVAKRFYDTTHLIMNHRTLTDKLHLSYFRKDTGITIVSMESILKCGNMKYDLIIFDEYESIVSHLESPTMMTAKIQPHIFINRTIEKCKEAEKIVSLDADLSYYRLNPILQEIEITDNQSKLYYQVENKWKDYNFNVYVDNDGGFYDNLENDILENKKLVIAIQSVLRIKSINKMINLLKAENPKFSSKNTLICACDYWKYNGVSIDEFPNPNGGFYTVDEVKEDIEAFIIKHKVDYWLYTPTIKTGISFNQKDYFDVVYAKSNVKSCVAREFLQMLFRARNVKSKTINIHIDRLTLPKESPTRKDAINYLTKMIALPNYVLSKEEENQDWNMLQENIKLCPLYKEWKIQNTLEKWNSQNNLPHNICERLHFNHQLPIKFIDIDENPELTDKLKEYSKLVKNEELSIIANTPLLRPNDMSLMRKSKRKQLTRQERIQIQKRLLINQLGKNNIKELYTKIKDGYFVFIEINNLYGEEYIAEPTETENKHPYRKPYIPNKQYINEYAKHYKSDRIITKRIITYADIYENSIEAMEKIYTPPKFIENINYSNDREIPIDNGNTTIYNNINIELTNENLWKMNYMILSRFTPFIYENDTTTTINLTKHKLSVLDYKNMLVDNEKWIQDNLNDWLVFTGEIKPKKDWKKFNPTKKADRKEFYFVLKNVLFYYGFDIVSPKNKEQKTEFYRIHPNKKLYYNKFYTPFTTQPNNNYLLSEAKQMKNGKCFIKIDNVKTQFFKRDNTMWKKFGNTDKHQIGTYNHIENTDPIIKAYEPRKLLIKDNTEDPKELRNSIIKKITDKDINYLDFFLRYKPKPTKTLTIEEYRKLNPIKESNKFPLGKCIIDSPLDLKFHEYSKEAQNKYMNDKEQYYKNCVRYYQFYRRTIKYNDKTCKLITINHNYCIYPRPEPISLCDYD